MVACLSAHELECPSDKPCIAGLRSRTISIGCVVPEFRVCVFCGGTPLTREHVYPQWLTGVLPEQVPFRGQRAKVLYLPEDSELSMPGEFRELPQIFTQTVVKRTCESCNSGWMNELEVRARPALTGLLQGRWTSVTKIESDVLALWVAKTCLMSQFTHPDSLAVPQSYIDWLCATRSPPPNMHIWAMPTACTDDWGLRTEHQTFLVGSRTALDPAEPCNTHCSVIGLGHVAFWILGTTVASLFPRSLAESAPPNAVRLWPDGSFFQWAPNQLVGDSELWYLREFLIITGLVRT